MSGASDQEGLGCVVIVIIVAGISYIFAFLVGIGLCIGLIALIWLIIDYLLRYADIFYSSGWGWAVYGLGFIFMLPGIIFYVNPSKAKQLSAILDELSKMSDR